MMQLSTPGPRDGLKPNTRRISAHTVQDRRSSHDLKLNKPFAPKIAQFQYTNTMDLEMLEFQSSSKVKETQHQRLCRKLQNLKTRFYCSLGMRADGWDGMCLFWQPSVWYVPLAGLPYAYCTTLFSNLIKHISPKAKQLQTLNKQPFLLKSICSLQGSCRDGPEEAQRRSRETSHRSPIFQPGSSAQYKGSDPHNSML